jgi:hypothetical protein
LKNFDEKLPNVKCSASEIMKWFSKKFGNLETEMKMDVYFILFLFRAFFSLFYFMTVEGIYLQFSFE